MTMPREATRLFLACSGSSALVVGGAVVGWAIAGRDGVVVGGLAALAALLVVSVKLIVMRITALAAEQEAFVNVRPLSGRLPLALGGWAVDPVVAERLTREVMLRQPDFTVEFGCGSSTVLLAAVLREVGRGRLLSVEHDERFVELVERQLAAAGLSDWVQIVLAPLTPRRLEAGEWPWYEQGFEDALNGPVDFLFVDGPPGAVARRARYPAIPVLKPRLAEHFIVMLDDGKREDERWIAERWAHELGGFAEFVRSDKGAWIIRPAARGE
jgi:predicted O-methyltransferase YrrM